MAKQVGFCVVAGKLEGYDQSRNYKYIGDIQPDLDKARAEMVEMGAGCHFAEIEFHSADGKRYIVELSDRVAS